jgi:hypothetical protein
MSEMPDKTIQKSIFVDDQLKDDSNRQRKSIQALDKKMSKETENLEK